MIYLRCVYHFLSNKNKLISLLTVWGRVRGIGVIGITVIYCLLPWKHFQLIYIDMTAWVNIFDGHSNIYNSLTWPSQMAQLNTNTSVHTMYQRLMKLTFQHNCSLSWYGALFICSVSRVNKANIPTLLQSCPAMWLCLIVLESGRLPW